MFKFLKKKLFKNLLNFFYIMTLLSDIKKKTKSEIQDLLRENNINFNTKMLKKDLIELYKNKKTIDLNEVEEEVDKEVEEEVTDEVTEEEVDKEVEEEVTDKVTEEEVDKEVEEEVTDEVTEEEVDKEVEEEVTDEVTEEEVDKEVEEEVTDEVTEVRGVNKTDDYMYNKVMCDVNMKIDKINNNLNNKLEMLMTMMSDMNKVTESFDRIEKIIDVDIEKTLKEKIEMLLEDENIYIEIINSLYRNGINFNCNVLDSNCHSGEIGNYFIGAKFDIKCFNISKIIIDDINNENFKLINEDFSDIEENKYGMVFNFNYLEYVNNDNIENVIKNLIKITNDKLIILVDYETDNLLKKPYIFERKYEEYIKIIGDIAKLDDNYRIDQLKIGDMPKKIIFLRKMLKEESQLLKHIQEEEKNINL